MKNETNTYACGGCANEVHESELDSNNHCTRCQGKAQVWALVAEVLESACDADPNTPVASAVMRFRAITGYRNAVLRNAMGIK